MLWWQCSEGSGHHCRHTRSSPCDPSPISLAHLDCHCCSTAGFCDSKPRQSASTRAGLCSAPAPAQQKTKIYNHAVSAAASLEQHCASPVGWHPSRTVQRAGHRARHGRQRVGVATVAGRRPDCRLQLGCTLNGCGGLG